MHAPGLHTPAHRSSRTRPGWLAALTALIAAGVLTVATGSPALAASSITSSTITISANPLFLNDVATVTITLKNTGNVDAGAYVAVSVPSGLSYVASSASPTPAFSSSSAVRWANVFVLAGGTTDLTFNVLCTTSSSRTVTLRFAFQNQNYGDSPYTRNQLFTRSLRVSLNPD